MAQGDVIQIAVGDTVTVSVTLDFKEAEIAKRPDKANFATVGFLIRESSKGKEESDQPFSPRSIPGANDKPIQFDISFAPLSQDPNFFANGDVWDVFLQYRASDEGLHSDSTRTHFLGRVGIGVTPPRKNP